MKTQKVLIIVISAFLASCGGDSGIGSLAAPNDGFEFPDIFPLIPDENSEIDDGNVTGNEPLPSAEISELFGQFSLVYDFTGDEQTFLLTTPFAASDVFVSDDGIEVLVGTARFASRETPDADFVEGENQSLACLFLDQIANFLCVADVGERLESYYLFGRLVDDAATGTWEFCNGVEDCSAELVNAPDGDIVALVTSPVAASARSQELDQAAKTDLMPYLQYLDQGTENSTLTARSLSSEASAIADGVMRLRESVK